MSDWYADVITLAGNQSEWAIFARYGQALADLHARFRNIYLTSPKRARIPRCGGKRSHDRQSYRPHFPQRRCRPSALRGRPAGTASRPVRIAASDRSLASRARRQTVYFSATIAATNSPFAPVDQERSHVPRIVLLAFHLLAPAKRACPASKSSACGRHLQDGLVPDLTASAKPWTARRQRTARRPNTLSRPMKPMSAASKTARTAARPQKPVLALVERAGHVRSFPSPT